MTTQTKPRPADIIPKDEEAEKAVLGSLLIDPDGYRKIADVLKPEHFHYDGHKTLYESIVALNAQGVPTDFITIYAHLEEQGKTETVQGSDHNLSGEIYILSLIDNVPTSENIKHYADIIIQEANKRDAIRMSLKIHDLGFNGTGDIVAQIQGIVTEFLRGRGTPQGPVHVGSVMDTWLQKLDRMSDSHNPVVGVPTGYPDLDRLLSGFLKKTLNILASRPACGKTSLSLNMALNAAKKGYHMLFFSMEMSIDELITKLISMVSNIDSNRLKIGEIYDDEWTDIIDAIKLLSTLPIWIDDSSSLSVLEVKMRTERLMVEDGIDMVVVDYLQLMRASDNVHKSGDRVRIVSEISRDLKVLAGELDIPVLALAQLSREVEKRADKHPILSDLRESGSLEQDSNVVMFIYRDEVYNPDSEHKNMADIIVAKHRTGPVGTVRLFFKANNTTFHPLAIVSDNS